MWLADIGGTLYFAANDGAHGYELWKSDGTRVGTVMVSDLNHGKRSSSPGSITDLAGGAYFIAATPPTGRELWSVRADM